MKIKNSTFCEYQSKSFMDMFMMSAKINVLYIVHCNVHSAVVHVEIYSKSNNFQCRYVFAFVQF